MTVDPQDLRRIGGHFATGVTVVAAEVEGRTCALTVNAFMTVSLDPPLVLVSIGKASRSLACLERAERFGISVLGEEQQELSATFALKDDAKLARLASLRGGTGVPLVEGAIAYLECRVERRIEAGDHVLFLARVEAHKARGGRPLLFHRGRYTRLTSTIEQ